MWKIRGYVDEHAGAMTDAWNRCAGPFKSTHALTINRLPAQILFFPLTGLDV